MRTEKPQLWRREIPLHPQRWFQSHLQNMAGYSTGIVPSAPPCPEPKGAVNRALLSMPLQGHPSLNTEVDDYGGYSFGFIDAWPSKWLYTQDVYVIEIDGMYYLCNPVYPGVNIALSFTL